jgi:hypothetical protein
VRRVRELASQLTDGSPVGVQHVWSVDVSVGGTGRTRADTASSVSGRDLELGDQDVDHGVRHRLVSSLNACQFCDFSCQAEMRRQTDARRPGLRRIDFPIPNEIPRMHERISAASCRGSVSSEFQRPR